MAATFKATYDNVSLIGEDISALMMLLAPVETPLLSLLSDPDKPATHTQHGWTEEHLGPDKITNSTAVNSATAATGIQINGFGNQLQVGMVLELETVGNPERVQISSIAGANSILVNRDIGGNGVNSLAAGGNLFVVSTAENEGSETSGDVTRPRTRRTNYTQIFKKPITVSGTDQAVITAPSVGSEFDHQTTLRSIEILKELEKALIRGVKTNSIGSASQPRTMGGLRAELTSINSTIASNSFTANPILYINNLLQQAWNAGARDINTLLVGDTWARDISSTNESKLQVMQDENGIQRLVEVITTDFGTVRKVLSPYMGSKHMLGIATSRVRVVPLNGRSFQREMLAKTGDAFKGHVIGEYTGEYHHPDKMFQARSSD